MYLILYKFKCGIRLQEKMMVATNFGQIFEKIRTRERNSGNAMHVPRGDLNP